MTFNQRYFRKDRHSAVNLHSGCCFNGFDSKNKTKKTVLQEPITFTDFIKSSAGNNRFIAYCNPDGSRLKIDNIYNKGEDALVMIGPEGDFTQDEVDMAITSGFKGLSLGSSRLRTETAGITACSIIYFLNQ